MKKIFVLLIIITLIPALGGCSGISSNYKELESLLVIDTIGVDYAPSGVKLTLNSAIAGDEDSSPIKLSGTGETITSTIEKIRGGSNKENLFIPNTNYMLIGEEAAENGINDYLSYISLAPEIKISTPIFVIKGATAGQAIAEVGNENISISGNIAGIEQNFQKSTGIQSSNAAELLQSIAKNSCALVYALEITDSAEAQADKLKDGDGGGTGSAPEKAITTAGYGVLRGDALCAYIGMDDALGVTFMRNQVDLTDLVVTDANKEKTTLGIDAGGTRLLPVWAEDGRLLCLDIHADVRASILDAGESAQLNSAEYIDQLVSCLEAEVSQRIRKVLLLTKELGIDFLDLGSQVELISPHEFRTMPQGFAEQLSDLDFRISVSGEIIRTNDIKDADK